MRATKTYRYILSILLLIYHCIPAQSQDSTGLFNRLLALPDKTFSRLEKETFRLEKKIASQTEKYFARLKRHEQKLYKELWQKDSVKAKEVFGDIETRYAELKTGIQNTQHQSTHYSGKLDSLQTALNFLDKSELNESLAKNLPSNLKAAELLKQRLNTSEWVNRQITERQQQLKQHLQNIPGLKAYHQFKKEVYYYKQQVEEYRNLVNDPKKLGSKLLAAAQKVPAFQEFFKKHSALAGLFPMPASGDPMSAQSLSGLQTRVDVQQLIQQQIGNDPMARQQFQQNLQAGQSELQNLKNKLINNLNKGGSGTDDLDFKPNNQRTKSFLQRLEFATNIQSQKANTWFPVTSDLGLSLGYKINDRSIAGIGASYKLGWGSDIRHINITHQGIGLRSFVDWKIKGSFWLSGGLEANYRSAFKSIDELKQYSAWQPSGLIGLSKVLSLKTKFFKQTKVQVLWDILSYRQVPRAQAIMFRLGYVIN